MARARTQPAPERDPLGEILHGLRLTGTLYCRAELTAPWGIDIPELEGSAVLQLVSEGRAWLEMEGVEPRWLERGSLSLVPRGTAHRVSSAPGAPAVPLDALPVEPITERYERVRYGGDGPRCLVTYGVVRFEDLAARRLLEQLPALLHIDPWDQGQSAWLQATAQLAAQEASEMRPGGETVLTRLTDVLVVQCIRSWLDTAPAPEGWLAALRDPQIGRALRGIHARPAEPWTVASLAQEAAMSRSAFAARFTALVGQPALRYLTEWRLGLARIELSRTEAPIYEIAERFGYGSEAAFSKAFKRTFGVPPGQVR